MKSISDIAFVVQARMNSQRVSQKMIRPFCDTTLLNIILGKLRDSEIIPSSNVFVSVYEEELKNIAKEYNFNIFNRSEESANNDNSLQKIYEWHDRLPYKYVIKINACSPLLSVKTIDNFTKSFMDQPEESLFGVVELKDYFWSKDGALVTPWPDGQTIMNTKAVEVTYKAAHVLYASRLDLISKNMFMGDFQQEGSIKLYPLNELECFDIDYEWQFKVGELLYKNV